MMLTSQGQEDVFISALNQPFRLGSVGSKEKKSFPCCTNLLGPPLPLRKRNDLPNPEIRQMGPAGHF